MFEALLGQGRNGLPDNSDLPFTPGTAFKGVTRAQDFVTGDALCAAIGLTAGVSLNSDAGWLHYQETGGLELYIAKKCIRVSATFTEINTAIQGGFKEVTINGVVYVVKLMSSSDLASTTHKNSEAGGDWNKYIYPVYDGIGVDALPPDTPSWGFYTDQMLGMPPFKQSTSNTPVASQNICRTPDSSGRSVRGFSNVASDPDIIGMWYTSDGARSSVLGFRPMLIRKDTLPPTPFKGEVAQADFITFAALTSAVGITTGTAIAAHANEPWLKIVTDDGLTRYMPKKSIRSGVLRETLNALNLITGNTTVQIGDDTYKVRLLMGRTTNPGNTVGKEWTELFTPLTDGTWASYTTADLRTGTAGTSLGELALVQESDSRGWAANGYPSLNGAWYQQANATNAGYGWRPVLELIP